MLYFTNSLGAAAGVLASGFVLIALGRPAGHAARRRRCSTSRSPRSCGCSRARSLRSATSPRRRGRPTRLLLAVAFFTGLASFIYEIAWIRMLSLVLGASTHSFELMLSTFILGLALGGLAVRRRVDRTRPPGAAARLGAGRDGLAALATLPVYDLTFGLMEALMKGLARTRDGLPASSTSRARRSPRWSCCRRRSAPA